MASFVVKNNAESLVADNPLAQAAVTLNVTNGDGTNFPSTFPFLITLWDETTYPDPTDDSGMEIVKCTARTTDALTIVRSQEGTADVAHALGERVAMLITAGILNDATYGISTKIDTVETNADVTDAVNVASSIHGVSGKSTPVDADELGLIDSAAANVLKKLTWANVKATLKTYFDSLYYIVGGADVAIADGGTGASTAADGFAALKQAATSSATGVVELSITSEINTGTSTLLANTPDALAGSIFGTKQVVVKVIADDTTLTVADGLTHFTVPIELNGMNLVSVGAHIYTVSSSGLPNFQIHNLTDAVDMLSTAITIDATENDSKDATTPPVINTATDDVATGDVIRFDCDGVGTGTKGMEIRMGFRLP